MTQKVTEKDVDAAEHRHVTNQLRRLAHWYSHWNMPKTIEECNKYNNQMQILIRRKEYLEYLINHKEKC